MKTVIEIVKEAGWSGLYTQWAEPTGKPDWSPFKYSLTVPVTMEQVERLVELVRADEREAWEHKYARLQSLMEIRETQPNKPCCLSEREACAKVCDFYVDSSSDHEAGAAMNIQDFIRARGQA